MDGELEMEIGDVTMLLTPGMVHVIPAHTPHSAVVKKDSIVIDVFSPVREEYKWLRIISYRKKLRMHISKGQFYILYASRFEQTGAVIGPNMIETFIMPSGFTVYKVKNGKIDEGVFVVLD